MRKIVSSFLIVSILTFVMRPTEARAEMPPKAKAFLTIVGYGTASGAILGAASMAFGNSTRAVAQGASIGLYAGILFGTYVLVSHSQRRAGNYDDQTSPYQESTDIYGDEYQSDEGGSNDNQGNSNSGFFDRIQSIHTKFNYQKEKGTQLPPIYLNLIQYNF